MPMMSGTDLFVAAVVVAMAYLVITPVYLLAMHALMPRGLLKTYWKTPYFNASELGLFTGTPLAPMRTLMLMGVVAFPRLGRKRGLMQAFRWAPRWYQVAARVFFGWSLACATAVVAILAGLNIWG